jgi:AraC-like DNA-binding protein/quercetin dioxygenase-like cupin family protein
MGRTEAQSGGAARAFAGAAAKRSLQADDYQQVPRPVAAMAKSFPDGSLIERHHHLRAQLLHAVSGVMTIDTDDGAWLVPPDRALWIPAGMAHQIRVAGQLEMRTLYVRPDASAHLPAECHVLAVTPLLRELVVRATQLPVLYDESGPEAAVMALILAEIKSSPSLPLHLPMPRDRRLVKLCKLVTDDLSASHSREYYAARVGISCRSLTRLFQLQTGMGFQQWRQKARLLAALQRLAGGESVTAVALGLGYRSPSAFTAMFRRVLGVLPREILRN